MINHLRIKRINPVLMNSRLFLLPLLLLFLTSCGGNQKTDKVASTGAINIDGSSTVYPITEAVAEEFKKVQPDVKIAVGLSGTGGGFKKFGRGETDINDASRPIKDQEASVCKESNIRYVDLKVAFD